ncbi:SDR family NAD(P)-dependent oxidoreductase [Psychrosphaera sp. F3M07]|uniref:SDR family NAD(P)-dependent oxidoreductase n=1 Tax=Psychrosphaera sp. F3M07 TaxID=2841560 RepID=UPI001C09FF7E|nr:SDR family NAD(P)-dependent oxidoreductase [Psychrosphaera sp. F3M07]MBU2919611.1 SDR family NAD(P)-dependent oxidoreductase [Psychrosphaera sp. F3M07]
MQKTILLTGATDGIGLATAKVLVGLGHTVLLHGRNSEKLEAVKTSLLNITKQPEQIACYVADLSDLHDVIKLANAVKLKHSSLDVLINNAGVFKTPEPITKKGLDVRFVVNTIAPYLLTKLLLPLMSKTGRVINLSSAAQAPVDIPALLGQVAITDDFSAYAQSKLAIVFWTQFLAEKYGQNSINSPAFIAVNPGSLLASKMVTEGFGIAGNDLSIGANIVSALALEDVFSNASGRYFDNDAQQFADPHPDATDKSKVDNLIFAMKNIITELTG